MGVKEVLKDFTAGAASGAARAAKDEVEGISVKVSLDISNEDKISALNLAATVGEKAEEMFSVGLSELKATADKMEYRWRITQYLFTIAVGAQVVALFI